MLDWLADKHDHPPAREAAERIDRAVDKAFAGGIKPFDLGGKRRHRGGGESGDRGAGMTRQPA